MAVQVMTKILDEPVKEGHVKKFMKKKNDQAIPGREPEAERKRRKVQMGCLHKQ